MIVDDGAEMRRLMRSLLEELAEEIFECSDCGISMSIKTQSGRCRLYAANAWLPMDGITASRAVTGAFPAARILIVTKYDDVEMREEAAQAGACGYVLQENLPALRNIIARA